tara:strand:+ start:342 stop:731 length:390 start_codon:yes stop_codon:yes gene_type:complete
MAPIYTYKHPDKNEYVEVIQAMKDDHVYIDEDGVRWEREYTSPNAQIKDTIDPFNKNQFLQKTADSKGTMGDMFDRSRELSEKRKERLGKDPAQEKWFDNYAKNRKGKRHWDDPKGKPKANPNNPFSIE